MRDLFTSGRIVDAILLLMALEAIALVWLHRRTGLGPSLPAVAAMLGAGLFLLLALRIALTGGAWFFMAAALAGSLVCHLVDLKSRWPAGHAGGAIPSAEDLRG